MTVSSDYSSESLHQRLSARLGNKGGARGSLTRCAGRLGSLQTALQNESGEDRSEAIAQAKAELTREIQLMQIEMTKTVLMIQCNQLELQQTQTNIAPLIEEERQVVEKLRSELSQASASQTCQQEYETLAKLASSRHPTSRRALQQQMNDIEQELESTNRDLETATSQVHVREAQFQMLLQCMLDLKQSLNESLELAEHEKIRSENSDEREEGEQLEDEAEPMDAEPTKEDKDDEGELYEDL